MEKTETGSIIMQNKDSKRNAEAKEVSRRRSVNHRYEIKKAIKDIDNYGKFFFELDVLTIAGTYQCITQKQRANYLKDFVIERTSYKDKIASKEMDLLFSYLDHDNFGFKLIANEGFQNVEKTRYLQEAFAVCHAALYFVEMDGKKRDVDAIHDDIKAGYLSLVGRSYIHASSYINRIIFRYREGFDAPEDLCNIADSYRDEIKAVYQMIYSELERRGAFSSGQGNGVSGGQGEQKKEDDTLSPSGQASKKDEDVLQKKLEDYKLMLEFFESQVEELKEYNSILQKEIESLLQEKRLLPEKTLIKLFNDLNSEQFGYLLDRIYLYAKGLEPITPDAARGIFTNIIAVLALHNFHAYLADDEYKKAITVKKEDLGAEYRCSSELIDGRDTYEAEVIYPEWRYGNKRIACKFIKLK